jgi:hypothetical protein
MKKIIFLTLLSIISFDLNAQISVDAQTVGYWSINDTQSFKALYQKTKIKDNDTISDLKVNYEIDITVIDSTKTSYTVEWFYKNYKIETDNELISKLSKVANNLKVKIKTDEFGAFIEVLNWQEIQKYIGKTTKVLKKELKDVPNINEIIKQTSVFYNSKEAIEANAIKDIQQYYTFYGGKYIYDNDVNTITKTKNNFGGEDFDTKVKISLDEIDLENDNYIIRMHSTIDSVQLTNATYKQFKNIAKITGNKILKRDEFPNVTNETWTASRIHGSTGWTTYSVLTKEVTAENTKNIEETTIQLK